MSETTDAIAISPAQTFLAVASETSKLARTDSPFSATSCFFGFSALVFFSGFLILILGIFIALKKRRTIVRRL